MIWGHEQVTLGRSCCIAVGASVAILLTSAAHTHLCADSQVLWCACMLDKAKFSQTRQLYRI